MDMGCLLPCACQWLLWVFCWPLRPSDLCQSSWPWTVVAAPPAPPCLSWTTFCRLGLCVPHPQNCGPAGTEKTGALGPSPRQGEQGWAGAREPADAGEQRARSRTSTAGRAGGGGPDEPGRASWGQGAGVGRSWGHRSPSPRAGFWSAAPHCLLSRDRPGSGHIPSAHIKPVAPHKTPHYCPTADLSQGCPAAAAGRHGPPVQGVPRARPGLPALSTLGQGGLCREPFPPRAGGFSLAPRWWGMAPADPPPETPPATARPVTWKFLSLSGRVSVSGPPETQAPLPAPRPCTWLPVSRPPHGSDGCQGPGHHTSVQETKSKKGRGQTGLSQVRQLLCFPRLHFFQLQLTFSIILYEFQVHSTAVRRLHHLRGGPRRTLRPPGTAQLLRRS